MPRESFPLPNGPYLAYGVADAPDGTHEVRMIDREALDNPRERAICRALLLHAIALLDESELTRELGISRLEP
jgi:hypothetical protein